MTFWNTFSDWSENVLKSQICFVAERNRMVRKVEDNRKVAFYVHETVHCDM